MFHLPKLLICHWYSLYLCISNNWHTKFLVARLSNKQIENSWKVYQLYNNKAAKLDMSRLPFCCFRFRLVCIIVQYPLQSSLHRHLQSFDLRNRHTVTYTFHYTSCTVLTSIVVFHCGKKSSVCQKCKTAML